MNVINIVDNIKQVNLGVWSAAIATAKDLSRFGVNSEIWAPSSETAPSLDSCKLRPLSNIKIKDISKKIVKYFDKSDTIIISHGCWKFPTKLGASLQKIGYKWIAVPQGMLEPYCMKHHRIKKLLYYQLLEKHLLLKADLIRAVSTPEQNNLKQSFHRVQLIPNGIKENKKSPKLWNKPFNFLFLARLHYKKGIVPLVEAWGKSNLNNAPDYNLIIAGPDNGELEKMKVAIIKAKSNNIIFVGPQYGSEKEKLLSDSHFYILPSFSEGFPTSVLEGMQNGLIPLITDGCNFPEAFENSQAIKISPNIEDIIQGLLQVSRFNEEELKIFSNEVVHFVNKNYSLASIAEIQYNSYKSLLGL